MNFIDWDEATNFLRDASKGESTDRYIDALLDVTVSGQEIADPKAVAPLIVAMELAEADFTVRSAALGLARLNVPLKNLRPAISSLLLRYASAQQNEFLATEILQALGVMSERNMVARAELVPLLMRIDTDASPFLLIRATKLIGRLETRCPTPGLREKLNEFTTSEDLAVQTEVRYQFALLTLADALLEDDLSGMYERLIQARVGFNRAELSAENRPDATFFGILLDLMLTFFFFESNIDEAARSIGTHLSNLREYFNNPVARVWYGYQSPEQDLLMLRLLHIGDAFAKMGQAFVVADSWRNFDEALVDLATMYALISRQDASVPTLMDKALSASAEKIALPRLGPLLNRAVGRVRIEGTLDSYKQLNGDDDVSQALSSLLDSSLKHDYSANEPIPPETMTVLRRFAHQAGETTEFFFRSLVKALEQGDGEKWARFRQLSPPLLPIDLPTCYGADSDVDETVRPLLNEVRKHLATYPRDKWFRLIEVIVEVVKFAKLVRDNRPDYTICEQDKGLGRQASEQNLQDDLFYEFRRIYGNLTKYELTRIAGGRVDTGLEFPELQLPIEIKHEFDHITRKHIREHFIAQADTYATARDRVSILMVLDLREIHAAGHKTNIPGKKAQGQGAVQPTSHQLYRLQESFWVETLPVDPDISNPHSNAVIVGLIPGNLPLPSGYTVYSKRR